MATKWQKIKIRIDKRYKPNEREAIAEDIVNTIVKRTTNQSKDKWGDPFPKYSKQYKNSLDFKIAGKSSKVNLKLSGDMLTALDLLNHKNGELNIGFEKGSEENARADGNIRGTYGGSTARPSKARDFLGINMDELRKILKKYPLEKISAKTRLLEIKKKAKEISRAAISKENVEVTFFNKFISETEI